jgi:transglutaminase-like putative cysteine protease
VNFSVIKHGLFLLVLAFNFRLAAQDDGIDPKLVAIYQSGDFSGVFTMPELVRDITGLSPGKKEQLLLLLLWCDQYMYADSVRFYYKNAKPLSTDAALKRRISRCYEFSNLLTEFCKAIKVPCLQIEGYVRYRNMKEGVVFEETNHVWNAIYIDQHLAFM